MGQSFCSLRHPGSRQDHARSLREARFLDGVVGGGGARVAVGGGGAGGGGWFGGALIKSSVLPDQCDT